MLVKDRLFLFDILTATRTGQWTNAVMKASDWPEENKYAVNGQESYQIITKVRDHRYVVDGTQSYHQTRVELQEDMQGTVHRLVK